MSLTPLLRAAATALLCLACAAAQNTLNQHKVILDKSGKLLSWVQPQQQAYDRVVRLAWDFLLNTVPVEANGLKSFYSYCCIDKKTFRGTAWPHNPAGVYAGLAESAAAYYAYSGDRRVVDLVKGLLDYQLAHGTTPANWKWGSLPYASSDHGAVDYRGSIEYRYDKKLLGRGDGYGVIEPDKAGELGVGYLKFYKLTGEVRYRDAAVAIANTLARNVRPGTQTESPWPFRVYAEGGWIREQYTSNIVGIVRLLDDLIRLNLGEVAAYKKARQTGWDWIMKYPMTNNVWANYFEDVPIFSSLKNLNQYAPMETARYLMERPEYAAEARTYVPKLISFVEEVFGGKAPKEEGMQFGARAISEQIDYMYKMGSHTARYASVSAMWHALSGDAAAREKAYYSFNWATYMCLANGLVQVGPVETTVWFTDGYGDYIRHFMAGLAAVPEWTPPGQNHMVSSSSIVQDISYAPARVAYRTSDRDSTEVLRLAFTPKRVLAGGKPLPSNDWTFNAQTKVLRIRHAVSGEIQVLAN